MHRRSLFLASCLLVLISLAQVQTQTSNLEWKNFGATELGQIFDTWEGYHLILFHNGTCQKDCSKVESFVKNNADGIKGLANGLKVHIVDYKDDPTIGEDLGIEEDVGFGLFGFSRGIPIRLDSDDSKHDLQKEVKAFFSQYPIHLETATFAAKASQNNKFVQFYHGAPSQSSSWAQFEVASRLAEIPFYYSNSSEVAALFGASRRRSFQTFDVAANHSIRMLDELAHENIERFVATSTKPVPQKFNLEALRQSTSNLIPVIVYRAADPTRHEYLTKVFASALQDFVKNYYHVYELTGSGSEEEK